MTTLWMLHTFWENTFYTPSLNCWKIIFETHSSIASIMQKHTLHMTSFWMLLAVSKTILKIIMGHPFKYYKHFVCDEKSTQWRIQYSSNEQIYSLCYLVTILSTGKDNILSWITINLHNISRNGFIICKITSQIFWSTINVKLNKIWKHWDFY